MSRVMCLSSLEARDWLSCLSTWAVAISGTSSPLVTKHSEIEKNTQSKNKTIQHPLEAILQTRCSLGKSDLKLQDYTEAVYSLTAITYMLCACLHVWMYTRTRWRFLGSLLSLLINLFLLVQTDSSLDSHLARFITEVLSGQH